MKIAKPVRGGGALGASMNLFERFTRVVKVKEINLQEVVFSFCDFRFNFSHL